MNRLLNWLAALHFLAAVPAAALGCWPVLLAGLGWRIIRGQAHPAWLGLASPVVIGWLAIALAAVLGLLGWEIAVSFVIGGRCLAQRRNLSLCLAMELNTAIFVPLGTALAIVTGLALKRPAVRALFDATPPPLPEKRP